MGGEEVRGARCGRDAGCTRDAGCVRDAGAAFGRAAQGTPAASREGARGACVLSVSNLSCGYGERTVLSGVSFDLEAGHVLALLGPNGVGKTTLFKTILGFLRPHGGTIRIRGLETSAWTRKDFAREVAYIPQLHTPSFSFSVHDVVLMGRTPHLDGLASPGAHDEEVACAAIERMGIGHLMRRDYASLSGGERQMVLIARAIAQQPRVLVMDEPCASLDFGNQARLLEQVIELGRQGLAVVMTTHDPNHALALESEAMCLGSGGVVACGPARQVVTAPLLERLYGVAVQMGGACVPLVGARRAAFAGNEGEGAS